MKKLLLIAIGAGMVVGASAQIKKQEMEPYRRSSLTMIMMDSPDLDPTIADYVHKAFVENPIPAKFNDHSIAVELRTFSPKEIEVTQADREEFSAISGKKSKSKKGNGEGGKIALGLLGGLVGVQIGPSDPNYQSVQPDSAKRNAPFFAYKYIKENNIAKHVVDKWFGAESGKLNENLIIERAYFNATEQEKISAAENSAGRSVMSAIMDNGGTDLLNNSFVTVSRFRYLSAKQVADEIVNNVAIGAQYMPREAADLALTTAMTVAAATEAAIGKGYVIYTTTYLYRLVWDNNVYMAIANVADDIDKYNALDCFSLEYIGDESTYATIAGKKKTPEEAVRFATVRSLDKVIAKLEKKYEVFRTKTPLVTIEPEITANIGTKECVEKGDKYEILERGINTKTNETTYKRIGLLTVDQVGNNMGEDNDDENASNSPYTTFKGKINKKVHVGSLIRQASK